MTSPIVSKFKPSLDFIIKFILAIGILSFVISVLMKTNLLPLFPNGSTASTYLRFADTCFLLTIALTMYRFFRKKEEDKDEKL